MHMSELNMFVTSHRRGFLCNWKSITIPFTRCDSLKLAVTGKCNAASILIK